ncbi:MAG TPA: GNAT family protein [Gaiellales bacterium]|nr:GNAT family protein [Gaiellales bacterium]
MTGPTLTGERVLLRPLEERDFGRLVEIGAEPEVARWWPGITRADLAEKIAAEDEVALTVERDGRVAGLIQFHEESEPDFRHAGIDIFLATECHGRGLGADAVRTLARHLFEARGHHRVTIDPAAANERAIRCYVRVGFRRVGVMRRYWRDPAGQWQDGLLLDLLAGELSLPAGASSRTRTP